MHCVCFSIVFAAMPGYHVVVYKIPRVGYRCLLDGTVVYGPPFMKNVLRHRGTAYECWPAGCFTMMSTRHQDWRFYELFVTDHPWHCVPYSHQSYSTCGALGALAEWDQCFVLLHGFPMAQTPRELCGASGFVEHFIKPMSENT